MKIIPDPEAPPVVKDMTHDALHDLIHFDKKIFRTLPVLLFKPGLLTEKTLEEPQSRYVRPFTLFVFINFLFFLVKSKGIFNYKLDTYMNIFEGMILKKQAALHVTMSILAERFNMAIHFEEKEYLIIMVPLFALILMLLFINRKTRYPDHLIFSLHFYSFLIIFLLLIPYILWPVQWILTAIHSRIDLTHSELSFILIIIVVTFIYLLLALRRLYRQNILFTILKSLFLSCAVIFLIAYVYRIALFFIVMRSISE
ncbi:MAG: DUF3667 domain-containing protein [Bacteroidota bacterium]|nr:DUF3667 domain-containing protein [Bacteroidota bacterium]